MEYAKATGHELRVDFVWVIFSHSPNCICGAREKYISSNLAIIKGETVNNFKYDFAQYNDNYPMIDFLESLSIKERALIYKNIEKLIQYIR
jgi:uncharacterized Fe-S cluster protein YjdI